jgi:hypothetical protein
VSGFCIRLSFYEGLIMSSEATDHSQQQTPPVLVLCRDLFFGSKITATAKAAGVRMLLSSLAQQCYIEAAGLGHGAKDLAAVILPMQEIAGVSVASVQRSAASQPVAQAKDNLTDRE